MRVTRNLSCVILGLVLSTSPIRAQDSVSTMTNPPIGGTSVVSLSASWGQTFTVPAASTFLTSFTFQIGRDNTFAPAFSALFRIALWNGSNTIGDDLYAETRDVSGVGTDSTSLETLTPPDPVAVTPGQTYLAFIQHQDGPPGRLLKWSPAGPGVSVLIPTYGVPETDSRWDYGFTARFSGGDVVPEPATVVLMATGLIGIGGVALRRRRKAA